MSWATLSGLLSIAGSVLLGYPSLRAAKTLVKANSASSNSGEFFDFLKNEMNQISVSWTAKLYWMFFAGFVALFLAGLAAILEATKCPTPW